ncbi:RelE family toxin-antitoxin system [Klebsiella pneumoniae]|uniref:ead/Ea22-like family protein n=1 Tax=Klebsiella pneumoniae TaxID=573 RepID=UPI000E2CC9FA|nr:ead/Ea22-like family protein [Klebsiella pneumoniae]SWT54608.1 RelE family toxin-antitoxin system [Klebsiella pneumoniae]
MTDITELAQSLKAAAEKATPGEWVLQLCDEIYATNDGVNYEQVAIATLDARDADYIALANPANVLALVDALEKAQQRIDELENDEVRQRLANAERQLYMAELAKNNLRASRKAQFRKRKAAEQRIAELESRTVKLPAERFCPAEYAGSQLWSETEVWNKAITTCADALRAAGIKVEAE